jgi:hypothetical protein
MRAVSSVLSPKDEVFNTAFGANELCDPPNHLFFNALRCLVKGIECACGMGWPVISKRSIPDFGVKAAARRVRIRSA